MLNAASPLILEINLAKITGQKIGHFSFVATFDLTSKKAWSNLWPIGHFVTTFKKRFGQ